MQDAQLTYEQEIKEIHNNLSKVKNKIAVMSGKGGVGKSTISSNLAGYLSSESFKTGILDVDIHGPSIPKILGLEKQRPDMNGNRILPVVHGDCLKAMSIGFLLDGDDNAVIWRGPRKAGVIRSLLKDVVWDKLDYLIIDCPPGTGDEPLSVLQAIDNLTGVVIVTTPQDIALIDVKKCVRFCNELNAPVLGVIENMSGFICPNCGHKVDIFKSGGGNRLSKEFNIPFMGSVPIDPDIVDKADTGVLTTLSKEDSASRRQMICAFKNITDKIQ
ncbi:MAG: Mrp/NBP35 family ATP-binding protein [Oligoflexia bacterium]|nr:Mrp/NBP35 family ATP-binding protein [Oligoflexia bacterium]